VQVFVDATIALPIVAHALYEKCRELKRNAPIFNWEGPEGLILIIENNQITNLYYI